MFANYDVFVLIIVLMSATLATYRGLVREVFSFIAWVGAAVLTFIFYPIAADLLKDSLKSGVVINMLSVVVTYFSLFFLLSGISALILDFSREVRGGPVDRAAGLLFGVFRGVLIVSLIHYCVVGVQGGPPPWLEKSEFFKLSDAGAKMVGSTIDEYVEASGERFGIKERKKEAGKLHLQESIDEIENRTTENGEIQEQLNTLDKRLKKSMDNRFSPEE